MKNRNSALLEQFSSKENLQFKKQNDEGTLLLLENTDKKDLKILKTIGFNSHIDEIEKELHVKNSKIILGQKFNRKSYLGSDIKKLCNTYDLTISACHNYKGAPHKDLPEIIKNFMDENSYEVEIEPAQYEDKDEQCFYANHKPVLDEFKNPVYKTVKVEVKKAVTKTKSHINDGVNNWFIMAPREAFNGNIKNTCCTLFYRDNSDSRSIYEGDVFLEVHSWGGNYSDLRQYNYFLKYIDYEKELDKRGLNSKDASCQFSSLVILTIFLLLITPIYMYSFYIGTIVHTVLILKTYLMIRKPSTEFLSLWKI